MKRKLEMLWMLLSAKKAILIAEVCDGEYFILPSSNVTEEEITTIHNHDWVDANP